MKPPSEADLILLENTALRDWRTRLDKLKEQDWGATLCVVSTLEYLIARARFHNQRQAARIQAKLSPRNGKSKPVSSVQPKHKKAP